MKNTTQRPAPYPHDLRAKGWRFELDQERIAQSDTWALASPLMRPWLLMTWMVAWQQTPCGSLPNSDELIAARIGMEVDQFVSNRKILLRGWWLADDGRLYHDVIAEQVIGMLENKRTERERKAAYRDRMAALEAEQEALNQAELSQVVPPMSHGTTTGVPRQSHGCDATGTGTGTVLNTFVHQATPDRTPDCPHQAIIRLFSKHLPNLPQPRLSLWATSKNATALKARWTWVMTANHESGKLAGSRIATTTDEGIAWFDRFFAHVARSDFLTGKSGTWSADLGFLVRPDKFANVIQGNYDNKVSEATA